MPARSKMVGVWETGEGEQVPPPRQPLPPWRYPHGPVPGDRWERAGYGFPPAPPQIRFPAGSTPDTAVHLISPRTDPAPRWGRGRSAAGAGGVGAAGRSAWVSLRRRGRGGGCRQRMYGYPYGGAGGAGAAGRECMGILCWRRGRGGGAPAEAYGYSLPAKARAVQGLPAKAYGYPPARRRPAGAMDPVTRERDGTDAIPRP